MSVAPKADTAKADSPSQMLKTNMSWAEKSFIMEAIDSLQIEVRNGARVAHLSLIGSRSWKEELERVERELGMSE